MTDLWSSDSVSDWENALATYEETIARQGIAALPALDEWFRDELPAVISGRTPPYVTLVELERTTRWKMARGIWRQRNLVLVQGNDEDSVRRSSQEAFEAIPHPTKPISLLSGLAGVGPATASAVVTAGAPDSYPFFDELVAAQVPTLGAVTFTLGYYGRYAEALRERASHLGAPWTPTTVERALWAHSGGKSATRER
jgi:hypothetical protein